MRVHRRRTSMSSASGTYSKSTSTRVGPITKSKTRLPGGMTAKTTEVSPNIPVQAFTSSAGMVVISASALLMFATWAEFWQPMFQALWHGGAFSAGTMWRPMIGAALFIAIMGIIASQSEDAAGMEMVFVAGLWIVFITMNTSGKKNAQGQSTSIISNFFDLFNPTNVFGGGAGGTFASTSKTSKVVPNPSAPVAQKTVSL
jgi:hypothetical protein